MKKIDDLAKMFSAAFVAALLPAAVSAQSCTWVSSTEGNTWQSTKVSLQSAAQQSPLWELNDSEEGTTFKAWGVTFNELDWDALCELTRDEQDDILAKVFSPDGDLKVTVGRISMNANDYSRSWYSCDEVEGDFHLKYFNIERDKKAVIPFVRAAQKYNPDLTFWISPWCPPSWMKINKHYAVQSSKFNDLDPRCDFLLYEDGDRSENEMVNPDKNLFPRRLTVNDFFIQDPRYLQTYANYFCKFIDAYKEQGIPVTRVMYQNEAYSYTPYPGCAWTAEGTIRFNMEYLAPTLKEKHPEVELYMGTFNTNRYDHVSQILSDPRMPTNIKGVGFQWEGRQILPRIRKEHPDYSYICSESECGWGSFDWKGAEHTFELINHYLGNGCNEYNFWNMILCDNGESPWGWRQNALIRVDSKSRTATFTPEYYAAKHYCHFVVKGSKVIGYVPAGKENTPVLVVKSPQDKLVVIAGNLNDAARKITLKLGKRYLNAELKPHSFNTFCVK